MKKVLFTATVDSHILAFHIPYLKLFKEQGYEVHVATNGDEEIPYCDKKIKISFERSPIKINNLKAIKQLKKVINEEQYDIIHCHTPMGSVVTRLAAKGARKKYHTRVIYTAHGFHFFKGAPLKNWLLFYPVEKYLSKYTDTLITINQEDYELAKNKFKKCKDIEYVPGVGIDEEKFNFKMSKKEKSELRKSLGLKDDDYIIIYPARLCKDKNQILLINLIENLRIKNVFLVLPGLDEYNGYYQRYIKKKGIKNIIIPGKRNDINQLLMISDLLIASSVREGFGINLVEALVSRIPVIAVNNRGHKEIIQNGINGYIIKNDISDLIEKFNLLYEDRDNYTKIKNNCYDSAKKFFLSNSIKVMKKIYKF